MVLLLFLFSSIYLKLFCVNGFLHFSPLSSCLCFLHLQYVCWVLHDSLRHGFQCLLCRWNLPFRLQTFFSDVILICHHQPDLVDEVVGDVGSCVGPGARQGVEASRGGGILHRIQEMTNIRKTLALQKNMYSSTTINRAVNRKWCRLNWRKTQNGTVLLRC